MAYNKPLTCDEAFDIATRANPQKNVQDFVCSIFGNNPDMDPEEFKKLLMRLVTEYEFDITADDNKIIRCCYWCDPEMVSYLIELGANVHYNNDEFFYNACRYKNINLVKFLLQYVDLSKNNMVLRPCVLNDNIELVNLLLQAGIDPNYNDTEALMVSSRCNYEITKLLLEYGANVNAQDDTALFQAALYRQHDIIELLLSYGANIACFSRREGTSNAKDLRKTYDLLISLGVDPFAVTLLYAKN